MIQASARGGAGLAVGVSVLLAVPVCAGTLPGETLYRERIRPPAGAVLVASLEDTKRVDAPAIELATVRTRLAGGPPYRWRLDDDTVVTATTTTNDSRSWSIFASSAFLHADDR